MGKGSGVQTSCEQQHQDVISSWPAHVVPVRRASQHCIPKPHRELGEDSILCYSIMYLDPKCLHDPTKDAFLT